MEFTDLIKQVEVQSAEVKLQCFGFMLGYFYADLNDEKSRFHRALTQALEIFGEKVNHA